MIGTPVVAVFPPSRDYALQVARWAPWAAPHRIVRAGAGLAGARRRRAGATALAQQADAAIELDVAARAIST